MDRTPFLWSGAAAHAAASAAGAAFHSAAHAAGAHHHHIHTGARARIWIHVDLISLGKPGKDLHIIVIDDPSLHLDGLKAVGNAGLALAILKVTNLVIILGGVMVVAGPVLTEKGFGKVTGIFGSLYNHVTGYFGDILSYSRLMALMLAGSVIAQVFNTLGAIPGNVFIFIIISMAGNTLNFALNLLGCYVHDLRLQCLEYFNKFYEDGGKPFRPLDLNTKYYNVVKD